MHRWHFQRLFRWLIPSLVFCVALSAVVVEQKASGGGLDFPSDDAYRNMAVAQTLISSRAYALQADSAIPAVRDVLWRFLLAVVGVLTGSYLTAAYLLGALLGLLTVLICLRLARLLFPFPPFILYSSILLIAAPGLLAGAMDGTSRMLTTALVTAAILFHVEGLTERRSPLSIACVVIVGFLMWVRIEFAFLWFVFFLHAFIVSIAERRKDGTPAYVFLRSITGWLILAMFMLPLIAWNLHVVRVPWPQAVGAPMTADAWAAAPVGEMLGKYWALAREGMRGAFVELHKTPFMRGILERVLAWFGALFIAGLAVGRKDERPFSIMLVLLLLLPVLYGFAYPFSGDAPAADLFAALGPLCIITAAFGIFRIPFLVEALYRKWKEGLPAAPGFNVWWAVMGSLLILVSLVRTGRMLQGRMRQITTEQSVRMAVVSAIRQLPDSGQPVVTDVPGWLAYAEELRVIDLSGESTPEVLACLDRDGRLAPIELGSLLVELRPGSAVVWDERNDVLFSALNCKPVIYDAARPETARPRVCAVNPAGAF